MFTKSKGFTLVEVLIVLVIVGILLSGLVLVLGAKEKELRDSKRVGDMQAVHSALAVVKNETGSFQRSYCPLSFVSMCASVENSELIKVLPELSSINDPKAKNVSCMTPDACLKKGCNYTIVKLEENDYEILFNLEKGSGQYNQGGCYKVTPEGISKK